MEPVLLGSPVPSASQCLLLHIRFFGLLSGGFSIFLDNMTFLVLFSRHFVVEILTFYIYYHVISPPFEVNYFSFGLLGSETCYLRPNWKRNYSKKFIHKPRENKHGSKLTNTQVKNDFIFDLSIWGQRIHYSGCHSYLSYFSFWCPSAHITHFLQKS